MNWQNILLVFIGSGLGGVCRFGIGHLVNEQNYIAQKHFIPTIIVNVVGSFIIGVLFAYSSKENIGQSLPLLWITGFLGGFTTYSSFSLDIMRLIQNGESLTALNYIILTLFLGTLAVFSGYWLQQNVF